MLLQSYLSNANLLASSALTQQQQPTHERAIPLQNHLRQSWAHRSFEAAAMAMTEHFQRITALQEIAAHIKAPPKPHHSTGIAKARRAARKRRNCERFLPR